MQVEDVKDRESLKAYLETLPEDQQQILTIRIAFKATARALPIATHSMFAFKDFESGERLSIEAAYSALSYVAAAAFEVYPEIETMALLAERVFRLARYSEQDNSLREAEALAVKAIASAAFVMTEHRKGEFIEHAVIAVQSADLATSTDLWPFVRADLLAKTNHDELWPTGVPNSIAEIWNNSVRVGGSDNADWSFWINWYERVRDGKNWRPSEVVRVLNGITKDDWDKGPAYINPMFDEVLGLYRAEELRLDQSYGFRAKVNAKQDRLDLLSVEPLDLTDVVKGLRGALSDYKRRTDRDTSHNQLSALCFDALSPEIADFRKAISKYKNDPQALHDQILRYEKHFIRVLEDRDLYQAAQVASLIDDMRAARTEICLSSEPVRKKEEKRTALAVQQATDAQRQQAVRNCLGMFSDGTEDMQIFAALALQALVDPNASLEEKQMAWQFAFRMGAEAATTIRQHEEKVGADKTALGKRLKEFSDMAVAGDKFVDVVQEAIAEGEPWVSDLFQFFADSGTAGVMV